MPKHPLPEPFETFLRQERRDWSDSTYSCALAALRHFCRFLDQKQMTIESLSGEQILEFSSYLKNLGTINTSSRLSTRKAVQTALVRMSKKGLISRDYRDWYPNYKYWPQLNLPVPIVAQDYLDLMVTITKPSSRSRFKIDLCRFHHYIDERNIHLKNLQRKHMEGFLSLLYKRGISGCTRARAVITLRKYLHWLHERNLIKEDPDILLRSKDCPQIVSRLPRPFEPEIDREIQKKFREGNDIFYDALLLMRQTGLRCGELRDLEFECLKKDYKGNNFLKVPLGKLNTERLVPLTAESVELVKKIQLQSQKHARCDKPSRLIISPTGRNAMFYDFRARMDEIQGELPPGTQAQSHQLRHSCATNLLNHGMSIVALKELLGHKDIRMTLNYAAVSPDLIRHEYEAAIEKMRSKLKIVSLRATHDKKNDTAASLLSDLISAVQKNKPGGGNRSKNIIRTLKRLQSQLKDV